MMEVFQTTQDTGLEKNAGLRISIKILDRTSFGTNYASTCLRQIAV